MSGARVLTLSLAVGFLPSSAALAQTLTPGQVLADIRARGSEAVREELYNDDDRWQQVIRGVESGSPAWLEVAQRLKGLRGHVSESLTIAVSRALGTAPRNVLAILNLAFDTDDVCSMNTLEMSLGDDQASALREVQRRQRAVASVRDPKLQERKKECLAFLSELERVITRNPEEFFAS